VLKYNRSGAAIIIIVLLLTSSLVVLASDTFPSAQAKPPSSHGHAKTTKVSTGGFVEEPPIGTEPLTSATANNSAAALAIAHRLGY
jgi:hypothetical protein